MNIQWQNKRGNRLRAIRQKCVNRLLSSFDMHHLINVPSVRVGELYPNATTVQSLILEMEERKEVMDERVMNEGDLGRRIWVGDTNPGSNGKERERSQVDRKL